ncbi:type 3 dihydrofolate reductase [Vibrio sp. NFV-1]|uniref:Dihydrofolate reductase n=2 Tax=Vibrio nitrifigilis TaxID=2789781 RepID=A0ABS0GG36_9VIBR|nr:type 3 dihydrofolate reductase [Vibrio nitrifigilis]
MIAALAHNGAITKENGFINPPQSRVIGSDNAMPWHLPEDFKWFKENTLGKPVVMGRKTYQSIGRLLPNRKNIIISRDPNFDVDGAIIVPSIEQAIESASGAEEVMVIGGGSVYEAFLPKAEKLYLTFIDADVDGDTHFPDWSKVSGCWEQIYNREYKSDGEKNIYDMTFVILERPVP